MPSTLAGSRGATRVYAPWSRWVCPACGAVILSTRRPEADPPPLCGRDGPLWHPPGTHEVQPTVPEGARR